MEHETTFMIPDGLKHVTDGKLQIEVVIQKPAPIRQRETSDGFWTSSANGSLLPGGVLTSRAVTIVLSQ